MGDHSTPGEKTSARLSARSEGLQRKSVGADGGEVYTGPLARKALRALGARAMTMDDTIFVDEGFDPEANAEDAALYAHERVHQDGSGGSDLHGPKDAEEMAARAIESMVLHRAASGADLPSVLREAKTVSLEAVGGGGGGGGAPSAGDAEHGQRDDHGHDEKNEAQSALDALLHDKSYREVVAMLKDHVLQTMIADDERNRIRSAPAKTI